jgi:hypothetical protein
VDQLQSSFNLKKCDAKKPFLVRFLSVEKCSARPNCLNHRNTKTNRSIFTMPPALSLYIYAGCVCMLRRRHFDSLLLAHCQTRSLSEIALGIPALESVKLYAARALLCLSRPARDRDVLTLFVLAFGVSCRTPSAVREANTEHLSMSD